MWIHMRLPSFHSTKVHAHEFGKPETTVDNTCPLNFKQDCNEAISTVIYLCLCMQLLMHFYWVYLLHTFLFFNLLCNKMCCNLNEYIPFKIQCDGSEEWGEERRNFENVYYVCVTNGSVFEIYGCVHVSIIRFDLTSYCHFSVEKLLWLCL